MTCLVASMGAWRTAKSHLNCDFADFAHLSLRPLKPACSCLSKASNEPMTPGTGTVQESNEA